MTTRRRQIDVSRGYADVLAMMATTMAQAKATALASEM